VLQAVVQLVEALRYKQ